ncbi:MAG: helix-turn-helix transcriptional regulator [Tunicatimonas sp.]
MAVIFFIWGGIQSLIVGIFIPIVKKARNNYLLSLVFLVTSLNILLQYLLRFHDWMHQFPRLLVVPDFLDFLLPTLVFLYVKAVAGSGIDRSDKKFLSVPLVAGAVLALYSLYRADFSFESYIGSFYHKTVLTAILIWKLFLFVRGWNIVKAQNTIIKRKAILWWPRMLTYFLGVLTYITFVNLCYFVLIVPSFDLDSSVRVSTQKLVELNYIIFTCSILLITIFFFFKYPKILSGLPIIKSRKSSKVPNGQVYVDRLNKLIEEDKIHLDTELNEQKLADLLGVQSYVLSIVLNDYVGKSFSSYINEKRIEEAKRLLRSEAHRDLTIFAIAVDSGFRSESVFYVNFKKQMNLTPKQYQKKHFKKARLDAGHNAPKK